MSRALVSPTIGDSDRPTNSPFVPPPIRRLSRSLTGFTGAPSSNPQSPSDRASSSSSQSISSPLRGPNRGPSTQLPQSCSSKPSNIFPRLHRLEIADDMAYGTKKSPFLELKLSSHSFLDAVAIDVGSNNPLYVVETVGPSTTIWRSDPWDGSATIADIRWPKELPLKGKGRDHTQGATVQMNGARWKGTSSLLKHSGLGSSRKFHIPQHLHALKWKKVGNTYTCTTLSCKGPVATLECFDSDTGFSLKVLETLGFHESLPQLDHAGISVILLDYLFVTALLLVTQPEDWMTVARNPASMEQHPDTASSLTASLKTPASNRQWRKIMYGEPLYPSLKTPAFEKGASCAAEDADVLDISEPPPLSTSMRQWRKIVYGEPLYPSLRPQSADQLDLPPRPSSAASFSSGSGFYPPTPSSAPSTYDVSPLFDDSERTAATRAGRDNRRQPSPLTLSPTSPSPVPSSECIPLSAVPTSPRARRGLPAPPSSFQPPASIQPWLNRSLSSPRLSHGRNGSNSWISDDSVASLIASPVEQDDPNDQSMHTRLSMGQIVRLLPSIPTPRDSTSRSSLGQGGPLEMNRHLQALHRNLPPTPASMSRSQSVGEQLQMPAQPDVPSRTAASSSSRPSTVHPGASTPSDADARRRQRPEKDPHEVINWMRSITRAHRQRVVEREENEAAYEVPPPAYNAIDFSTPPQARSPEGT